jgi:hypothetical protein
MLKPKYNVGQRVWYTGETGTRERVRIAEVWWGGVGGSPDFWIPKYREGQQVRLRDYGGVLVRIERVYNFKSSWECDRSDIDHGGSIVRYKEPRYYCVGNITGTFYQSELEAVDKSQNTEADIRYDVCFGNDTYKIVKQTDLGKDNTGQT